jgi:hypothetical protein
VSATDRVVRLRCDRSRCGWSAEKAPPPRRWGPRGWQEAGPSRGWPRRGGQVGQSRVRRDFILPVRPGRKTAALRTPCVPSGADRVHPSASRRRAAPRRHVSCPACRRVCRSPQQTPDRAVAPEFGFRSSRSPRAVPWGLARIPRSLPLPVAGDRSVQWGCCPSCQPVPVRTRLVLARAVRCAREGFRRSSFSPPPLRTPRGARGTEGLDHRDRRVAERRAGLPSPSAGRPGSAGPRSRRPPRHGAAAARRVSFSCNPSSCRSSGSGSTCRCAR